MSHSNYMKYEADYAGSRTKNRFGFEIYWGLDKFLAEMRKSQDFTMVFDFVCDIEIHFSDRFEFYQVKTSSNNSCTTSNLTSKSKKKNNSIIGTLYKIRHTDIKEKSPISKLAIVSNARLSDKKVHTEPNTEFLLKDMEPKNKEKILQTLRNEFGNDDINLDDIFFISTDLGLSNYQETMVGRINTYYKDIYGEDPLKPGALLNVIVEEVQQKANYELKIATHEEVLEKKGVGTDRIQFIFNKFAEEATTMVDKCKDEIKITIKNLKTRLDYIRKTGR
uniref:dsDNA nuclease domain-containing protein n=1 Tax=Candidatus Enterococcus willemsii TaxID=1857215 RepID=UPI00403F283F